MGTMASQVTSLTIVYSTVYSGTDQTKHQSSASLAFVWENFSIWWCHHAVHGHWYYFRLITPYNTYIPYIFHQIVAFSPSIFSCNQAALQMVQSVRLSVRHTFLTMFPSSYHHEIFRSYYQWQKWCPCKSSRSEVKGQGRRGHNPT